MSPSANNVEMSDLLQLTVEEGASDLHIRVGLPPMLRIHGALSPLDLPPLTPEDTERLMKNITSPDHQQGVREHGGTDFGFGFGELARFRVSVFKERGNVGIVLRQIPSKLLTLEQIGLPPQVNELLYRPRGLILVTGPTGSGKSTTLASMINVINADRDCHIITVEDPIEYYHTHRKSIVTQREIGVDVPSFAEAIRRALRQDPDVILVGEMRDLETMQAAITAAETGHLVFATLHTTGAAATVDRIVDAFPTAQQEQVRTQLSVGLVAVISQLLLVRADRPGRIAAFEVMISTSSIRARIRDNKTFQITSDIQTGAKNGMITLDAHLLDLYLKGLIHYDDLITKAQDPDTLVQQLQETLRARGK
ncbi:MAG: type IV pilus twitching motility protein PilT [Kiritimatiellia bacterium]